MPALRRLRLSLTLLYLMAALALIALVGIGTYLLVDRYFQSSTDLTLRYKMATQLSALGAPLTPELVEADRQWRASRGLVPSFTPTARPREGEESHEESEESHERREQAERSPERVEPRVFYDGDLAAVFVFALDSSGQPVTITDTTGTVSSTPSEFASPDALAAALVEGSDMRTVSGTGGLRARLLTYRLPEGTASGGAVALQVGRMLTDQDRVLEQMLVGLLVLSGASALVLGAASWWLAGRSLKPAQQAWERQQAFVANASHELRAPLTLMRANAEVALRRAHAVPAAVGAGHGIAGDSSTNEEQRALLQDIVQEADHMAMLVDDLLLLSRLDAGRIQLQKQPVDAGELLEEAQRHVSALAEQRGVAVVVDGASGTVQADRARLRQVLLILLDNALRHTPAGGRVTLSARPEGHSVRLAVADTGEGISAEHLPHVFERFYRASSERGEEAGGSGLGLSIARGLVEAHHGLIVISSEQGKGTTVEVVLPAG
ncbi:MAG TPA: HAMP domain-containing sensor histidine kinase [Chloroflexia bacterium]|nr:HAMP domain-containing sensor histidine kinase [Chloroflexia bacterium]